MERVLSDRSPCLTRWKTRSDQPLWHDVPVRPVEELLLHMVVPAGPWRARRVLVVEDQLRRLVVPRLQEAHHLAIVGGFILLRLLAVNGGEYTGSDDLGLEVRGRAALGDW